MIHFPGSGGTVRLSGYHRIDMFWCILRGYPHEGALISEDRRLEKVTSMVKVLQVTCHMDNIPAQTCVFQSIPMLFQLSKYTSILSLKTFYGGFLAFSTCYFYLSTLNTVLPFKLKDSSVYLL